MKKQFLLLTLFACFSALAQLPSGPQHYTKNNNPHPHIGLPSDDREAGDVIYENDFSDFGTWMVYTESGTTPQWELVLTTPSEMEEYLDIFTSPTNANGFAAFNAVHYLIIDEVEPLDALLELNSSLNCTDNATVILEFFMAYRAFNYDKVFVEITNNDWVTFETIELFEEQLTNDPTRQEIVRKNISDVAAGQPNVRIRFRFQELGADPDFGSGYGVMVDDLSVREAWDYDQKIIASHHRSGIGISHPSGLDYYKIATSQLTEIYFSGITENYGAIEQEGAKFNVDITGSGSFSSSSLPISLPYLGSDSLGCVESFTPDAIGTFQITAWFDSDNPEQDTNNDTLYSSIKVMYDIYARHNGIATSSIKNVSGNEYNPFLIGNTMDFFENEHVSAIEVYITNDPTNIGKYIYGQIMLLQEDGTFLYMEQTNDHVITAAENGGSIRLYFEDCVAIASGQTVLVLAGHYGGDAAPRFNLAQPVEEQTVLGYTSGADEPFFLINPSAVMIDLLFESSYCSVDLEDPSTSDGFNLYQNSPNPCSENTILPYELTQPGDVKILITDLTGKIVFQEIVENVSIGANIFELNTENFPAGTCSYTFIINGESLTKKMMVVR
jgi:hypothetical protein